MAGSQGEVRNQGAPQVSRLDNLGNTIQQSQKLLEEEQFEW